MLEFIDRKGIAISIPTTLSIDTAKGVIIITRQYSFKPVSTEWRAELLTYHSIEGEHIIMKFVQPLRSIKLVGLKRNAKRLSPCRVRLRVVPGQKGFERF